jgi:two-component system cell cycle sensor histidine kinase/response regulator CckA
MDDNHQNKDDAGFHTQIMRAEKRTESAEVRVEQAEARTEQAKTRTEQAETRTEQAETRTELAKTRIEQAEIRTERAETRSEQAIQASELLYRRLFETAQDGILILDADTGQVVDANPFMKDLLGYSQEEFLGRKLWEIGPFKGEAASKITFAELQLKDRIRYKGLPLETKDGRRVEVEFTSNAYLADQRKLIQCNIRDITEAKKVEARFRRLVDSNAQGVIFWNKKGEITEANEAFLRLVGYTRADLKAGHIGWMAMTPPEYASLDLRALEQIAATGTCAPYEKEFICHDGARVPILLGAAIFEDNPDEGVCFVLDLTERKKLEQQVRQSQKMDAIGQLAGGVAHDFNNILAVIQLQADLLKTDGNPSPEQLEFAEEISAAAQRAAALTRQLLLFSRKENLQLRDLDLNQSINDMTKMLRRTIGENMQTQFKFAMEPLFIHADASMMDQVLMNLVVNARDAMPKGGRLVIETSTVTFDESAALHSAQVRPGSFVCLSVSDTGCGIPPENLPRIFEPFFTTKEVGKGTGLGLATVFGIVQHHQGWVNVYSEVGHGTTFRIYLPRLVTMSRQKPEPLAPIAMRGGNETILLVEDDAFLRASVRKALSQLGYRVLEAINGVEAREIWKLHRDEIRLLLTDLVMPGGVTGKDLVEILLKENPKLKVIYASGYSAEVAASDFPLEEGVNFLTKPFQAQELAKVMRERLDANI